MPVFSKLRPGWVVAGGLLALVLSFATSFVVVFGYAFFLAVQARGAPDTAAISRFAAGGTVTWLSFLGTAIGAGIASWIVARRTRPDQLANCLAVGVVIGVILLIPLLSRGDPALTAVRAAEGLAVCAAVGLLTARTTEAAT
jgi:hypothetical protein